jgi:hypothetical protein
MSDAEDNMGGSQPLLAQPASIGGQPPLAAQRQLSTPGALLFTRQRRRQIAMWTINFCLGAATVCIYLIIDRYGAILPWLYTFGLLVAAGSWWDRASRQHGRLLWLLITSFLIVSLVGMLEVSDNLRLFGTIFGVGGDDSEYFFNARSILQDRFIPDNAGIYELVLAAWGFLPNLLWRETTTAFEFLPLNWVLGAVVVGLCDELCFVVIKQRPPAWLLVVTLLGNYKFTDATIHLYRDGLLLVFFLLAVNSLMRSQHLRSVVYSVPVLALRAANFALYIFVLLLSVTLRRSRTRVAFYGWVTCILCVAALSVRFVGPQVFRYATRFTFGPNAEEFAATSFLEEAEFRGQIYAATTGTAQSTTLGYAMANGGPASMVLRPITYELFPIRFWSLEMGGNSASRFAVNVSSDRGLTLRNLYLWFSIMCWVIVVPLVVVGLGAAAIGSRKLNISFIYYLISVFAVSFISFELRHATAFIIFHPLLSLLGYNSIQKHARIRVLAVAMGVFILAGLCAYNSFSGALL